MERELVGKKRTDNNSKSKVSNNNSSSNNNSKSNTKSDSALNKSYKSELNTQIEPFDKKSQKEIPNKPTDNLALDKKQSFNSESDESELINKLLEKKLNKNSIIKNFNDSSKFNRNINSSNKYSNCNYKNENNNNFGIKFSHKRNNNVSLFDNDDEEILSEDINSISEENYDYKTKNKNDNKKKDYNLGLNESSNASKDIVNINEFSKTKRFEFSLKDEEKVDIKINKENRKLVLNESLVSSDDSEPEEITKSSKPKGINLDKFRELIAEEEKLQAESNASDFIGFKAPYSTSAQNQFNNTNNNNSFLSKNKNNINNKSTSNNKKDITTADFIGFSKTSTSSKATENTQNEQNQILSSIEFPLTTFKKPLFPQYPWITAKTAEYKGMPKLHFEICDFYDYIKPLKSEHEIRKQSFMILKELIVGKFTNWRVKVFGSFPNEIFLSDSDVDIVVISSEKKDNAKKTMDKLNDYLSLNLNLFDYIKRIDAKVPIIKLQLKETKINMDISVDRKNGYDAKRVIKKSLNDFHALKPLIYLLKYFMRQKKLNETFSGGVSSFLLFNLVLAFLQYKSKTENTPSLNLGQLLVDFFQFYGFEFNYDEVGISVRYGGFFYKRKDKDTQRPAFLSIENFQDIGLNIGSGAYKFRKVLDCFKQARDSLYYPSTYPIHSYVGQFITTDSFLRNRYRFLQDE